MLIRTNILQKTLVGCSRINSVFCDSAKCGFFIQASIFRPGFELSQTVDFKKGVAFWNNSTCVNQSITESHRHLSRKTSDLSIVSQSAVIGHIKKKKTSCANQEYNTNSELARFILKRSVYEL